MSVLQPEKTTGRDVFPSCPELSLVEDTLYRVLSKSRGIIKDACCNLVNAGGKRIRPLLTLNSALCFGPLNTDVVNAAAAAELIHMASLVHDDVIDKAETRRGKPTVNSMYGNNAAVLTGDYMFAEAFQILANHQLLPSMGYLVEAIQAMCDGEVNQAQQLFDHSVCTERYLCRIAKKTGILLASCCKSGAATAGATPEEVAALGEYGLNLGYAFQIVDDILDFVGESETVGKPIGGDIVSGNVTLPVIILMDNPIYGDWIKQVLGSQQINTAGVESIKCALMGAGSIDKAYQMAASCVEKAKASLEKIPASPYKAALLQVADLIYSRQT
jgi:heptaprenyl diphosphate synthase